MDNQANTQHNKLMKLDDTMLMYGIYNAETLEKVNWKPYMRSTIQHLHIKNYLQENITIQYSECFTQML